MKQARPAGGPDGSTSCSMVGPPVRGPGTLPVHPSVAPPVAVPDADDRRWRNSGERDRHTTCQRIINCSATEGSDARSGALYRRRLLQLLLGSDATCMVGSASRITAITALVLPDRPLVRCPCIQATQRPPVIAPSHIKSLPDFVLPPDQ